MCLNGGSKREQRLKKEEEFLQQLRHDRQVGALDKEFHAQFGPDKAATDRVKSSFIESIK